MRTVLSSAFLAPALLATLAFSSCGSGGGSGDAGITGGSFVVVKTEPANNGQIFLNQTVKMFMSNPIDLSTASFNSVVFTVTDLSDNPVPDTVLGKFQYGRDENGVVQNNILEFQPRLPTNDTFTDGGFKPGRIYRISLVSDTNRVAPTLRDQRGQSLSASSPIQTMIFRTASGKTPQELFLDVLSGGPRVTGVDISPTQEVNGQTYVTINRLGELPVEVKLDFNQPLNPSSANIPLRQDPDPLLFAFREKGRIFLEYDETRQGENIWIPAQVEVLRNDAAGASIVLRPDAVLPNNATVRVIVEADFQDISGESNVKDASYVRQITTFRTLEAFEPMFDSVLLSFAAGEDLLDPSSTFRDPVADLNNGILHSSFDFEGLETPFDFIPSTAQKEIVLRTDVTTVQPRNGPPLTIVGGVFQFNRVEIPDGVTVRAEGPNPMVLISRTTVTIGGRLLVDGHAGEDVFTENSGQIPTKGGVGQAGGGDGGRASQTNGGSTQRGESGFGAGQVAKAGGEGGQVHCLGDPTPNAGAGGGGGSFRTRGDDNYYGLTGAIVDGSGGRGQTTGSNPGPGGAGTPVFIDPDPDNDFWGRQITADGDLIVGEMPAPVGGSGGGGGGDQTTGSSGVNCDAGPVNYINDRKGGGGGGGGGVLIIKALGPITIPSTGFISASGGNGGGGQPAGSSLYGGGGGGGSGGMIVLMSADRIQIDNHNNRWDTGIWDPEFAIAADGGIGQNYKFGTTIQERFDKYPGIAGAGNGAANRGGFGSLGVVQLMVPPGDDSDNTGSVQDDNIIMRVGSSPVTGNLKLQWLNQGDIRPQPIIMPVPFGRYSKARTRWISTGATVRREALPPVRSAGARSINKNLGTSGPEWFFSGLEASGRAVGYVKTDPANGIISPRFEESANITVTRPNDGTKDGLPVHRVRVSGQPFPVPNQQDGWSYTNYRARLKSGNSTLGEFRIVDNSRNELWLDATEGDLPSGAQTVEVYASFIEAVNGFPPNDFTPGLGETFQANASTVAPRVNFQVGFAFHQEPWRPEVSNGKDSKRFPQELDTFLYDLDVDNFLLRDQLRALHYPYVQVEVRFNLAYNPDDPNLASPANELETTTRRPGLKVLRLPYRF